MMNQKTKQSERRFKKVSRGVLAAICMVSLLIVSTLIANVASGTTALAATATVTFTKSGGWLESAYAEWSPVTGASGYNVYYKQAIASDAGYNKIDGILVRQYPSSIRADVLGLTAGTYVVKVVPTANNVEILSAAATTSTLTVKALTREGFAFSAQYQVMPKSSTLHRKQQVQSH